MKQIIITDASYMWNQNGTIEFDVLQVGGKMSFASEHFPISIEKNSIRYVFDKGFITYGYDTVREIYIRLSDGSIVLWNKCAESFLSQYKGEIHTDTPPRSVKFK